MPEAGIVSPDTYFPKVFPPLNDTVKFDGNLNALITTSPDVPDVATVKSLLKLNSEVAGRTDVPLLKTPTVPPPPVPLMASDQDRFPEESITRTLVLELSCVTPLRSTCFIFILCDMLN